MNLEGVFLARHGETNDNLEPIRVQGFTDNEPIYCSLLPSCSSVVY